MGKNVLLILVMCLLCSPLEARKANPANAGITSHATATVPGMGYQKMGSVRSRVTSMSVPGARVSGLVTSSSYTVARTTTPDNLPKGGVWFAEEYSGSVWISGDSTLVAKADTSNLASWTMMNNGISPDGIMCLEFVSSSVIFAGGYSGAIYRTTDGGNNWNTVYYNTGVTNFIDEIKFFDANNGMAWGDGLSSTSPQACLVTTDGGTTWTNNNTFITGTSYPGDVSFVSPSFVAIAGYDVVSGTTYRGVWKSTDAGINWSFSTVGTSPADSVTRTRYVAFKDQLVGVVSRDDSTIWSTSDGGATWNQIGPKLPVGFSYVSFVSGTGIAVLGGTSKGSIAEVDVNSNSISIFQDTSRHTNFSYVSFPTAAHGYMITGENRAFYSASLSTPIDYTADITVDGTLSESKYVTIATKQNANSGFGTNMDISRIVYYVDAAHSTLYLGVVGKLPVNSDTALGLWLNFSGPGSPTGAAAGSSLGGITGGGLTTPYFATGGGQSGNYKADFEVDYQFCFNTGFSDTIVYFDAAKMIGTGTGDYLGSCDQAGTPSTNANWNGSVFGQYTVTFAFNNSGQSSAGLEIAIPFSQLGVTSADFVQAFAFAVGLKTSAFSNVTVPGDISAGNPGLDPDFGSIAGGPFHGGNGTTDNPLPVEAGNFSAVTSDGSVTLSWKTQSEVDNLGFNIYRKDAAGGVLSFIAGYNSDPALRGLGTSTTGKSYSFTDNHVLSGHVYDYTVESAAADGTRKDYPTIEVKVGIPKNFALYQNYPNPFNPTTTLNYDLPKDRHVTIKVYDMLGREVATLVDENKTAGSHQASFDGSRLSSGVYLYRIQAGTFTAVKKLVLMK